MVLPISVEDAGMIWVGMSDVQLLNTRAISILETIQVPIV